MIALTYFCLIYYGGLGVLTGIINVWHERFNSEEFVELRYQEYRRTTTYLVPAGIDELLDS